MDIRSDLMLFRYELRCSIDEGALAFLVPFHEDCLYVVASLNVVDAGVVV